MSWWRGSDQIRERGSLKLLLLALVYLALGIQRKEKNETGIPLRILYLQTNLYFWPKHPNVLFFQVDHYCYSIKIQNDFRTYFRTFRLFLKLQNFHFTSLLEIRSTKNREFREILPFSQTCDFLKIINFENFRYTCHSRI